MRPKNENAAPARSGAHQVAVDESDSNTSPHGDVTVRPRVAGVRMNVLEFRRRFVVPEGFDEQVTPAEDAAVGAMREASFEVAGADRLEDLARLERAAIVAESAEAPPHDTSSPARAALDYLAHGWHAIPVPAREKGPTAKGWQTFRFTAAEIPAVFFPGSNVGLLTGAASGNLIDLDLDCPAAVRLARAWAPKTRMVHGRTSRPSSHRWYQATGHVDYLKLKDPEPPGRTLVELRNDTHQTLVPPSIHPEGDSLAWEGSLEPDTATAEELVAVTRKIAAGALLADRWSKTSTHGAAVGHDAGLALAGFFLRRWSLEETQEFLGAVAEAAGGDRRKVEADIRDTHRRLQNGGKVTGGHRLLDFFTPKVVTTICDWLGLSQGEPAELKPEPAKAETPTGPPADWVRPGDGLAANPLPIARVKTRLPTLDTATRGGLPTGSASLYLGGPDAGKTGLAMTVADGAERQGFTVIHLAPDGGREAAEIRWAQIMGFDRDKLEERDPDELARFRGAFAPRNVFLPDPDRLDGLTPVNTLTRVIDTARQTFSGRNGLLLIDSIQAVKPDTEAREPRMRLEAVLALVRQAANTPGWLVVATSQTNRASRRHKNEADNTDPMTAGMESGAIEHVFDLMVYLDGDASGPDGARARITKNKPGSGRKPIFRLQWHAARARFTELDADTLEQQTVEMVEREAQKRRDVLLTTVTKTPGLSTAGVLKAARACGIKTRSTDLVLDLQALKRAALITDTRKGNGYYWHPTTLPEGEA